MAKKTHWSKSEVTGRDLQVIKGADHFTTFRYGGPFKRDRREFPTLIEARADQGDDPRAMVYAVMGNRDAFIPRGYEA